MKHAVKSAVLALASLSATAQASVGGGPVFDAAAPCGQALATTPNAQLTFSIGASDPTPNDFVRISASGVPAGMTFNPPLPTLGNPVNVTASWTPTNAQLGTFGITFTATDNIGNTNTCSVMVNVSAECFLVVGQNPGFTRFTPGEHEFIAQVDHVRAHFPVRLSEIPSFPLPSLPTTPFPGPDLVHDVLSPFARRFTVQVMMWNPWQLPNQPEQWTDGLEVFVFPNGHVSTRPYGHSTGMRVWAETTTDATGQRVLRFPFSIPGF